MPSTFRSPARGQSASEVAARATDAAMRAAEAAIKAADAAIKAADAAVRLIDEHDGEVIVLEPVRTQPRGKLSQPGAMPALPAGDPFSGGAPRRKGLPMRILAVLLIFLGAVALADAATTLVWQEPFSALYAKLRQDHLRGVLKNEERAPPTPYERQALAALKNPRARIAFLAGRLQRRAAQGSPVGRIVIPNIGADFVVVNGTSTSALQSGPGIYPATVFPGAGGTTAIAGHRTTYLAPFRHVDALHAGNRILLDMPYARFTYAVTGKAVVPPTDVGAAVNDVGYSRLVLSACTPLFSASKRLLVYARLQSIAPAGGGPALGEGSGPRPVTGVVAGSHAPAGAARGSLPAVLESAHRDLLPPLGE